MDVDLFMSWEKVSNFIALFSKQKLNCDDLDAFLFYIPEDQELRKMTENWKIEIETIQNINEAQINQHEKPSIDFPSNFDVESENKTCIKSYISIFSENTTKSEALGIDKKLKLYFLKNIFPGIKFEGSDLISIKNDYSHIDDIKHIQEQEKMDLVISAISCLIELKHKYISSIEISNYEPTNWQGFYEVFKKGDFTNLISFTIFDCPGFKIDEFNNALKYTETETMKEKYNLKIDIQIK
jgi:hypothetical protein